jgi:hypothetical protein
MSDPIGRGDVEAVRRANEIDPDRKIHDGGLAVSRG